ncbi:MAG TPA: exodeoxyribonuclease VII large subunit [Chloroflexi bacterium]|nr:exodeoxyribonuclease VII large subunit [Chloroflexota bacterium]|tara:strand:+ start:2180 stop:3424 length:1245 start_codon:yes stop_codon:yes gene_type:complete
MHMSMQIPFRLPGVHWTVSELTDYVRDLFENDRQMHDVAVIGELSNVSRPQSGHVYFSLKDKESTIQCVMWRSVASRLVYFPHDGDRVIVYGNVTIYPSGGRYQLYASTVESVGAGDLLLQAEILKDKLAADGLFDSDNKKILPALPVTIAIVTSPSGAAYHDMLNVINRRWPIAKVQLIPTSVQGTEAPAEIVDALNAADNVNADVILLGRGGGDLEDLAAFNSEDVVRAIFATETPIVTGIGHETDFTLADLASDLRAPTPSAAAEISTPDHNLLRQKIYSNMERISDAIAYKIQMRSLKLDEIDSMMQALSPTNAIQTARQKLNYLYSTCLSGIGNSIYRKRLTLEKFDHLLDSLGPNATLNRGYAIVTRAGTMQTISDSSAVSKGQVLDVLVEKGKFEVEVGRVISEEQS